MPINEYLIDNYQIVIYIDLAKQLTSKTMSAKAITKLSKTMILVFGLGFIGLLAGFYFNKVDKVAAEGPIDFVEHLVTETADNTVSAQAADMDYDNDIDIFVASRGDNTVAWYENDGNENFTRHVISNSVNTPVSVYPINIDGDSDMDVLSAAYSSNSIIWHENDGSNLNFNTHTITSAADGAVVVYAENIDGDSDMDILSASHNDHTIAWYEKSGGNFIEHLVSTSTIGAADVYAKDVDGDSDMDILSASEDDNLISWYENDGNENFIRRTVSSASSVRAVYAIDIDNDNDIDVLGGLENSNAVIWYENDGDQNFIGHTITNLAPGVSDVYAEDMDNDQDIDILSASPGNNTIAWYENDGDQNFTRQVITETADTAYSVRTKDINGDNKMDVLSASAGDDTIAWYENNGPLPPPTCNDGIQNGDETGVDCGGSCQYSCTVPVIVVHGFLQDVEDIDTLKNLLDNRLDNLDNPVYAFDYAPGNCNLITLSGCTTDDIKNYALSLDNFINTKLSEHNARYVDLVGYCMGGLMSRWHVQSSGTNKVRNLIGLAVPNHGALVFSNKFFRYYEILSGWLGLGDNYYFVQPALQMTVKSQFIRELNGDSDYEDDTINDKVRYRIVGGTAELPTSVILWGQDDGVVTTKSLKIYNVNVPDPATGYFDHFNIDENADVADYVASIINNSYKFTYSETSGETETEGTQQINLIEDNVIGQKSHNIRVDNVNSVSFLMSYDGDYTNLTIESPDHTIYSTEATSTLRYLQIDNPLAGDWTLTVSSTDADYQIFTFVETDIILEPNVDSIVTPGESILISANLSASSTPLIGADVTATIFDDARNEYLLNLADQGNGTYSNTFSQTNNAGFYEVNINASSTIADIYLTREAYTVFESVDNPDLAVSSFTASFDDANYELELNATIENLENVDANNFTLRFYDGEPGDIMSTMIREINFSLGALDQAEFTATTTPLAGQQDYYVTILKYDDEDDYTNNDALFSIYIPSQCSDGTNPNQCSINKPMYCVDGELVNNCQLCGCPVDHKCSQSTNMCVYYHEELPIPMSMF